MAQLLSRLEARGSLERVQAVFGSRRQSEAARQAFHELATVMEYAERLGVGLPVVIHAGESLKRSVSATGLIFNTHDIRCT